MKRMQALAAVIAASLFASGAEAAQDVKVVNEPTVKLAKGTTVNAHLGTLVTSSSQKYYFTIANNYTIDLTTPAGTGQTFVADSYFFSLHINDPGLSKEAFTSPQTLFLTATSATGDLLWFLTIGCELSADGHGNLGYASCHGSGPLYLPTGATLELGLEGTPLLTSTGRVTLASALFGRLVNN